MRIGHGFDVHQFSQEERDLILCGVKINHPKGLIAHSDGDVVLHAITDAILGAAALGDIGQQFPDSDQKYLNINSAVLLQASYAHMQQTIGYSIGNLDVTIIAQVPYLQPYILSMRQYVATIFQCEINQINIKATTTERLGFIGREEGIAATAVVILQG